MVKRLILLATIILVSCIGAFVIVSRFAGITRESRSVPGLVYTLKTDDSPVASLVHEANVHLENKDFARAEAVYREVVREAPEDIVGYVGLAATLFQQERFDEAREQYFVALALDPQSVQAMMGLGSVAHATGDYDHAVEYYSKILLYEPKNPDACWGLAITYESMGDTTRAIEDLQRTIDLAPNSSFGKLAREHIKALQKK